MDTSLKLLRRPFWLEKQKTNAFIFIIYLLKTLTVSSGKDAFGVKEGNAGNALTTHERKVVHVYLLQISECSS